MGKHDDYKRDLDNLYKVTRDVETKLDKRTREIEQNHNSLLSDVKILNSGMSELVGQMGKLFNKFEVHDGEEMEKYTKIEKTQAKVEGELILLRKNDESLSVEIKEVIKTQKGMKANQDKFFKIIYIGSGFILAFGFALWVLNASITWNKAKEAYVPNYSEEEKSEYYNDRIKESEFAKEILKAIEDNKRYKND